jgi:hypothetical protein
MTDRIGDEQLDREILGFLAWRAEQGAAAPSASEVATRISANVAPRKVGLPHGLQIAWLLLAALLIVALLGALVIGRDQAVPNPVLGTTYEAIFLRLEVVEPIREVVVVAVNDEGRERQVARLPDAWLAQLVAVGPGEQDFLAPMGAVSPSGLLTIPSNRGEVPQMLHWELFDLAQSAAEPIVIAGIRQYYEFLQSTPYFTFNQRGGAFWGPGERLAILWYHCDGSCTPRVHLTFVEGSTGATRLVDAPGSVSPYWASDGSGVFVGSDAGEPRTVLRPDGTIAYAQPGSAQPSCRTRDRAGTELSIRDTGLTQVFLDGHQQVLSSSPAGSYACFAPDDSAIVFRIGIGEGSPATASKPLAELIVPSAGRVVPIQGNFAGWLEVPR